jgi:SPP1 gp7 family putative phage head morphogenesis protein
MSVERAIKKAMAGFFVRQFHAVVKRNLIDMDSFDWVASQGQADEIYRLTHGQIGLQFTVSGIKAARQIGVQLTDFVERPRVIQAAREHTYKFALSCGSATRDRLQVQMATGLQEGESIEQLKRRVQSVFGIIDPERAENYRAEMIARTESARAITSGTAEAWRETGVVSGKEWDASGDACPFCMDMHGRTARLGDSFFKQGQSMRSKWDGKTIEMDFDYMDVDGPPLHPNCRCALLPVLIEMAGKETGTTEEED